MRARCSRPSTGRSARTRPALRWSETSRSSAPALLADTVEALADGRAVETPQPPEGVTYAAKLTKAESAVAWTEPAARIHNLVRGLQPWPLVAARLADLRVLVHRTELTNEKSSQPAGTVLRADGDDSGSRSRRRQRHPHPGAPARRATRDEGAGVPRREAGPGGRVDRAGMIAPARVAAYDVLRMVGTGRQDLPQALAKVRSQLERRARSRAGRRDRYRLLALAGGARSHRRQRRPGGRWLGSIPRCSTSFA